MSRTAATRVGALAAMALITAWTAWGQVRPDVADEIDQFYAGTDDETREFLRRSIRGSTEAGPGEATTPLVAESAFRGVPADELKARRDDWLQIVAGDRYQAIESLGAAHCTEAVPALLKIAADRGPGDSLARWLAIRALGRIGDARAVVDLIHLVRHPDPQARQWAKASLYRLTGEWFGDDREAWGRWWNQNGGEPRYVPEERYPVPRGWVLVPGGDTGFVPAGDAGLTANGQRAWSPEQATGAPDTPREGDIVTAWASLTPDGGPEWLELAYATAVAIAEVRVHETYNPGAVRKVTAIREDGQEVPLWEGRDPTARAPGVFAVPVQAQVTARRVKLYLDSAGVRGWNEIDAVELLGADGTRQWATDATASSTYADRLGPGRLRVDGVAPPLEAVPATPTGRQ